MTINPGNESSVCRSTLRLARISTGFFFLDTIGYNYLQQEARYDQFGNRLPEEIHCKALECRYMYTHGNLPTIKICTKYLKNTIIFIHSNKLRVNNNYILTCMSGRINSLNNHCDFVTKRWRIRTILI